MCQPRAKWRTDTRTDRRTMTMTAISPVFHTTSRVVSSPNNRDATRRGELTEQASFVQVLEGPTATRCLPAIGQSRCDRALALSMAVLALGIAAAPITLSCFIHSGPHTLALRSRVDTRFLKTSVGKESSNSFMLGAIRAPPESRDGIDIPANESSCQSIFILWLGDVSS